MKNERSFINQIKIHQYFSRLFNSAVLLFIFSLLTFSLGIVNHYSNPDHVFYNLFSFSKQSNFLILLVSIMCLTPFKKSKFYFYITFITLISILLNVLVLRNLLYDANQIFTYELNTFKWIGLMSNFLEYLFMPLLFVFFYFEHHKHIYLNYRHVGFALLYLFLYFFVDLLLIKIHNSTQWSSYPHLFLIHRNFKDCIWIFIKIILSFICISYISIYFFKIKNTKRWYICLFILFLFCITTIITTHWNDWKHAKKSFTNSKMGSLLWPESLNIAKTLSDVTTQKDITKKELQENNYKILELGAGTGNVTNFLVNKYGQENIIAIEFDPDLCNFLQQKFSPLKIIQGDASKLITLLRNHNIDLKKIYGIVSTLPLSIFTQQEFDQLEHDLIEIMKNSENKQIRFNEYRFLCFLKEEKLHTKLQKELKIKPQIKCCFNNWIVPTLIYTFETRTN